MVQLTKPCPICYWFHFLVFSCAAEPGKSLCVELSGECEMQQDGYYYVSSMCVTIGACLLVLYIAPTIRYLEALNPKMWKLPKDERWSIVYNIFLLPKGEYYWLSSLLFESNASKSCPRKKARFQRLWYCGSWQGLWLRLSSCADGLRLRQPFFIGLSPPPRCTPRTQHYHTMWFHRFHFSHSNQTTSPRSPFSLLLPYFFIYFFYFSLRFILSLSIFYTRSSSFLSSTSLFFHCDFTHVIIMGPSLSPFSRRQSHL